MHGCFYHLCSNMWKRIQQSGLQERYINDPEFNLHLRMISVLAFAPPNHVQNSFDQLPVLIRNQYGNGVDGVLDYFEDNYVGRFRVNSLRVIPTFPIDFWNLFHRTDEELPRTNNAADGWHRGFHAHVSACHTVFWKFLKVLQKEETVVRVGILQNEGGHQPSPQRRRYVDCNQRILRIVDDFPNRQRIDYLRSIAHNLAY